ncbi:MAG: glycosyltransferase family 2 protein, partial [Candidatus Acidiferrales bacterium]
GVTVVVPAYNEEGAIASQIENVRVVMDAGGRPWELIVVDDGSTDGTAAAAERTGARLIRQGRNRGYGAALKAGIHAAQHELIVITDADGTYPSQAIPALLEHAAHHDMVVGARIGENVAIPLVRRPAKWLLGRLASYMAEQEIPDLNSGLRVMKKSLVEKFEHLLPSGFSFTTTITLALLCSDYSVHYHAIEYHKRVGQSKIRPGHAYQFLMLILRTIVYFNPLRFFLPLGAVFFAAGVAKFGYDITKMNLSESAAMGVLTGVIIWCVGLLADQISRMALFLKSK